MKSRKMVMMNLFIEQEYIDVENKLVDKVGERKGGTIWESSLNIYRYYHVWNR